MLLAQFVDQIAPRFCAKCSQAGEWICAGCLTDFSKPQNVCPWCGDDLPSQSLSHPCAECLKNPPAMTSHLSLMKLNDAVAGLIHAFKYNGEFWVRRIFELCLSAEGHQFNDVDLILPIPLHVRRMRKRGYNQSWLLAQSAAGILRAPARHDVLMRVRNTPSQTQLDHDARKLNVRGAFAIQKSEIVRDKQVLLIDDVRTTGATLKAASRVLMQHGAKSVRTLAFAAAPRLEFSQRNL